MARLRMIKDKALSARKGSPGGKKVARLARKISKISDQRTKAIKVRQLC